MTDRLQEIRARLDAATHTERTNAEMVWDSDKAYHMEDDRHRASQALHRHAPADIAWLLGEVDRLSFQEKNMKRIQKDLQDRHQILASERKKNYSMDVRMVNDGREF